MQKIIINNFGAVKNAEIDIKKVLILIGEQASGKSTIAKLIYFFRSLRNNLINQIISETETEDFNEQLDFIEPLRKRFYNLFGATYHLPNFEITFYYSFEDDKYIRLTLNEKKELNVKISNYFFSDELKNSITELRKELYSIEKERNGIKKIFYSMVKSESREKVFTLVNNLFQIPQLDNAFIISGRNATVSYSDLFEKYLFATVENNLSKNNSQILGNRFSNIDSELMSNFIKHTSYVKSLMYKQDMAQKNAEVDNVNYEIIRQQFNKILKGFYYTDDNGERIIFDKHLEFTQFVHLSNASSGQQEVIRILQDLLYLSMYNEKATRIIEEPEAHLFPIAQKQLVELFALMVNQDIDNQLIITTHSPYILAAFNNLLFAKRVIDKNPNAEKEVSEIVASEFRLESNEFAAYSLTHNEKEDYCTSIMSERGLISENYLDTVSDILAEDFEVLYDIHSKTYARK